MNGLEVNRVYCEDNLVTMGRMPDCFVDLTVTSPPYDNLRDYRGFTWNFEKVAVELFRVTKDGGVVVWVVNDSTDNGSESGTSFKQALYFKEIGFNLHDTMIYAKENPIPLTHNRYEQSFEYMFVLSKEKPKTFNPLKDKCLTYGQYNHRRNTGRVAEAATRNRDEKTFVNDFKQRINIWYYVVGDNEDVTKHPAPFPEQLAADHIYSWSNKGDLVYDCFAGSGTTLKMAHEQCRNWIGSEISPEYCQIIEKRLKPYLQQTKLFT